MRFLVLAAFLTLCACMAAGGGPSPIIVNPGISQTSQVEGSGVIGSVLIGAYPWTYPIRWNGQGKVTLQYPMQPHILLDGAFVWEPIIPEQAPAILAAQARGEIAVVSGGRPVAMSAPGSIPQE